MICNSCRRAGQLNTEFVQSLQLGHTGKNLRKLVKATHQDCPGGNWCDCQHATGQYLNTLLTKPAEQDTKETVE